MKIRTKILLGFLILSVMLAIAGAYSIYELTSIGSSVQQLLDDNYQSITAAKNSIFLSISISSIQSFQSRAL